MKGRDEGYETDFGPQSKEAPPVTVLAGWEDHEASDDGEIRSLLEFGDWETVRGLYALVGESAWPRSAARRSGFRVLGAGIEVDTPKARAWRVDEVVAGELTGIVTLGQGLLLSDRDAATVRRGDELEGVILEVRDDGILLVKSDDGFATIDLTALAAEGDV